jgi:hypothetical protein
MAEILFFEFAVSAVYARPAAATTSALTFFRRGLAFGGVLPSFALSFFSSYFKFLDGISSEFTL